MVELLAGRNWGRQNFLNGLSDMDHVGYLKHGQLGQPDLGGDLLDPLNLRDDQFDQPVLEDAADLGVEHVEQVQVGLYYMNVSSAMDLRVLMNLHPMMMREVENFLALGIVDGEQVLRYSDFAFCIHQNDAVEHHHNLRPYSQIG